MTTRVDERDLSVLEQYRSELTGHCYRMLGSAPDADDAVQETMVRAWQALDGFEGRSSVRSWLYRIATNVCLDALRARGRRALPMDLSAPVPAHTPPGRPLPEATWIGPIADASVGLDSAADPAERAVLRDSVRLAFVAALQHLPPRQRAVLLLREVLRWPAADVAELLDTTVASVNSALQRARATLTTLDAERSAGPDLGVQQQALLHRYVQAFEAYDIDTLVRLMHEDAVMSMPPLPIWLRGVTDLRGWYLGHGAACRGSRLVPLAVNGCPGFAQYHEVDGVHQAWSVQVVEIVDGRIAHVHHFLQEFGGGVFDHLGLPVRLP